MPFKLWLVVRNSRRLGLEHVTVQDYSTVDFVLINDFALCRFASYLLELCWFTYPAFWIGSRLRIHFPAGYSCAMPTDSIDSKLQRVFARSMENYLRFKLLKLARETRRTSPIELTSEREASSAFTSLSFSKMFLHHLEERWVICINYS